MNIPLIHPSPYLSGLEEVTLIFADDLITLDLSVLIPGHWAEEVSWVGQTIRSWYVRE